MLGHADLKTTQRYAKVSAGPVQEVAASAHTAFLAAEESASRHDTVTLNRKQGSQLLKILGRARQDSNLRPTAPEAVALSS